MNLFPHTGNDAEDQMAKVPMFCCGVPLALTIIAAIAFVVWRFA